MDESEARPRARAMVWVEWGAVVVPLAGVAAYLIWKPLDPMADPRAAQALALVQTHPARSTPTIRQAIDAIVKANRKDDRTPMVGDWTVRRDEGNGYLVRVVVRLPGDEKHRWIEWDYLWRGGLFPPTPIPPARAAGGGVPPRTPPRGASRPLFFCGPSPPRPPRNRRWRVPPTPRARPAPAPPW